MKRLLVRGAVPAALLGLLLLAFGPMIPFLGFFWDDWPVILTGRLQGASGFLQFYQYDRPVSAWTYIVTFPILGSRPLAWHVFTLLLRWGTAVAMWWTLVRLWPHQRREATWAAALFAVYPVFTQQSISVAYSQHWICYLLYFLSIGAMVQAFRSPRLYRPLTALALLTSIVQILTMEYFAGLELIRPFLLWILLKEQVPEPRRRALQVMRAWLPYLMTLGVFVIWRLFFLDFPGEDANPPVLLLNLLSQPLDGILRLAQIILQDTAHLLVSVWANILAPANIIVRDAFILFSWGMGALAAVALAVFLLRAPVSPSTQAETPGAWARQAALLGLTALLLGMLPVWFTDRQIIVGTYSNRFGLPAMFGCSLLITALLSELVRKPVQRVVLVSILVGLAVAMHLRVANDYRWSWMRQMRFYWQLSWRAPAIEPGTAVFSDGEIFKYVGLYSTAAGINLLYPPQEPTNQLPYYFYSLGREFAYSMPEFLQGIDLKKEFRHYTFDGHTKEGIMIYYNPDEHDCLEVLVPQDANAPDLPEITRKALRNANTTRILPGPRQPGYPPEEIFGPEPEHGWCYLYQKADLAAQQGDWETVYDYAEQARAAGYDPKASGSNTPVEWMPFIEAYGRKGDWDRAEMLSLAAFEKDSRIDARLCNLWNSMLSSTPPDEKRDRVAEIVKKSVKCPE